MTLTLTEKTLYLIIGLCLMGLQIYQFVIISKLKNDIEILYKQVASLIIANFVKNTTEAEKREQAAKETNQ